MNEALALQYNPWGFDESDYRVLNNRFVTTRRPFVCDMCFCDLPAGTRARAQREIFEGHAKTFKFCPTCCEAMVKAQLPIYDDLAVEKRMQLGQKNAAKKYRASR
jgi:hypothetical protein